MGFGKAGESVPPTEDGAGAVTRVHSSSLNMAAAAAFGWNRERLTHFGYSNFKSSGWRNTYAIEKKKLHGMVR